VAKHVSCNMKAVVGFGGVNSSHKLSSACVIGNCRTMIKLPQRVAHALSSSTLLINSSRRQLISSIRAANLFHSSTAHIHTRTPASSHVARAPTPLLRPSRKAHASAYIPTYTRSMSSDAEYAAFLDKANQDVAPAVQQDLSKKGYGTKSVNTAVPKALEGVEDYYVSDADEPFEPVALEFSGESVSASMSDE
jgi:hypothetical protein